MVAHVSTGSSPAIARPAQRLLAEASPYLRQHANNPVDWYPWGDAAFARARAENRPVFLSIGYSTCHWCHVMERESFEDPAIADYLNRHFIAIKLDREQYPDIDEHFMMAVLLMNGHGGWPMSCFLTPGGQAFWGGTYYPPKPFLNLLQRIHVAWVNQQPALIRQAEELTAQMAAAQTPPPSGGETLSGSAQTQVRAALFRAHDALQGGFGQAPKFPHETWLEWLADLVLRDQDAEARAVWEHSLDAMARGGIYDQIGGGFHRYSTDSGWLVPHFEKMLYNQAQLGRVYLQAWLLTGNPDNRRVTEQTLDYVLREMTDPEGGFYTATDADSEGEEGRFFVWQDAAIAQALDPADAELARRVWGITPGGNFEGANIPFLPRTLDHLASDLQWPRATLWQRLDGLREHLRSLREQREPPLRDEKILTGWNGLMLGTLALAGAGLQRPDYLQAAWRAADFLWRRNRDARGALWRSHLHGQSSVPAVLEDYAYFIEGLLFLYDATGQDELLRRARELMELLLRDYWDSASGGFFTSLEPHHGATTRSKSAEDGALPAANGVALLALAMLHRRTGEESYRRLALELADAFAGRIAMQPTQYAGLLTAWRALQEGETGAVRHGAGGKLCLRLEPVGPGDYHLKLEMAAGWHINSAQTDDPALLPTRIVQVGHARATSVEVDYPTPQVVPQVTGASAALKGYHGQIELRLRLKPHAPGASSFRQPVVIDAHFQACGPGYCLAPEQHRFYLP